MGTPSERRGPERSQAMVEAVVTPMVPTRIRVAALLGIVAALAGCTPEPGKPQPAHSSSPSSSEASTSPSDDLNRSPAPAASPSRDVAIVPGAFHRPEGIAVDTTGNVYVADTENHTI